MFKREKRREVREYMRKVNAGEIDDPVVSHGADADGNVIGDNGEPVPGTAPAGQEPASGKPPEKVDYSKFKSHAELNGELTKLNLPAAPEGWTDDKPTIAEKQAKLTELAEAAATAGGW